MFKLTLIINDCRLEAHCDGLHICKFQRADSWFSYRNEWEWLPGIIQNTSAEMFYINTWQVGLKLNPWHQTCTHTVHTHTQTAGCTREHVSVAECEMAKKKKHSSYDLKRAQVHLPVELWGIKRRNLSNSTWQKAGGWVRTVRTQSNKCPIAAEPLQHVTMATRWLSGLIVSSCLLIYLSDLTCRN